MIKHDQGSHHSVTIVIGRQGLSDLKEGISEVRKASTAATYGIKEEESIYLSW
jgi:hypothetical protein